MPRMHFNTETLIYPEDKGKRRTLVMGAAFGLSVDQEGIRPGYHSAA